MAWARRTALLLAAGLSLASTSAWADANDLVLSRLGQEVGMGVVGSNAQFRSMASELGVALAPRLTEPADTLGFGGFHFVADVAVTSINGDADYWRVLEEPGSGSLTTTGIFVKKGIWLPLPSFEVGAGAIRLGQSHVWASQAYVKFALQEGYQDLPIPSVAVRGAVSRMMGSEQLDLTVASLDLSASKDFGIAGMFKVSPYGGLNWLFIVPRSEVIDKTPHIDSRIDPDDAQMNFVFSDQDNIIRQRLFLGTKVKYYIFTLTLEANIAFAGSSIDDQGGTDTNCNDAGAPTNMCDAEDGAGTQTTFTTSLGLDF